MKSYSITSLYVAKERKPVLEEMVIHAKTSGTSLNELIWNCIESGWSTVQTQSKKRPSSSAVQTK